MKENIRDSESTTLETPPRVNPDSFTPEQSESIRARQLAGLFKQTITSQIGAIIGAAITTLGCVPYVNRTAVLIWIAIALGFISCRLILWLGYRRHRNYFTDTGWYVALLTLLVSSACLWPAILVFIVPPTNNTLVAFVCVATTGISAAAVAVLAYRIRAVLAFSVPSMSVSASVLLMRDEQVQNGFGLIMLVLLVLFVIVSRRLQRTLTGGFILELDREVLVSNLRNENLRRAQSERELIQNRDYLNDILDNGAELVHSADADRNIVYVNRSWQDILGYSAKEAQNLHLADVIHPDSLQQFDAMLERLGNDGGVEEIETDFITAQGERVYLAGSCSIQIDDSGIATGTRAMLRDVTAIRNAKKGAATARAPL